MKPILLVFLAALVLASAIPSHKRRWSKKYDDSRTEKLESLPVGAKLPNKSTFLDKKETSDGNLVFGQYSYIDPLSNLVIVKYTVGTDGKGYSEKRLLTVNYKADENSVDATSDVDKIDVNGADEEELIDRIVEKLLPEIRKAIRNEKSGKDKETETGILTPSSLGVFGYFHTKLSKMESIMSQILCEMMTSQAGNKKQKPEDELIAGIIFKVIALMPEGTLLDYAKKLSRHVRSVVTDVKKSGGNVTDDFSPNDIQTTTFQPETTTLVVEIDADAETEVVTTKPIDISDIGDIFGSIFLSFLTGSDNSTANATSTEEPESLLGSLLSLFFDDNEESSSSSSSSSDDDDDDEEGSISSFLKQVISHGQDGFMGQIADLLLDVESLFSLYTREAVCLGVPNRGVPKPVKPEPEASPDNDVDETTTFNPENDPEEPGEPKIDVSALKPEVKSVVEKLVTSSLSSGPVEDEKLIGKILMEVEMKVAEKAVRNRKSDQPEVRPTDHLSDEILTEEDKDDLRPIVTEAIHNQRLKLHQMGALKDWPSKNSVKTE